MPSVISATLATPITDIVLTVVNTAWSLDSGIAASGHIYQPGEVLSMINTKYVPYDNSYPAVGVAYTNADASSADAPIVVLARGGCVDVAALVWDPALNGPMKGEGLADLKALHIIPRNTL